MPGIRVTVFAVNAVGGCASTALASRGSCQAQRTGLVSRAQMSAMLSVRAAGP